MLYLPTQTYRIILLDNNSNDFRLIEQLREDNLEAFDKLFAQYARKLYGFAFRYLKSEADAEELVQDIFLKVWENRKGMLIETSFKSYLFKIAYNDILKFFRKKAYHQRYVREALAISDNHDLSSERIDYASALEEVNRVIELLPERRRLIFKKSRQEGKSSKEIAEQMNLSPGTVDNNISKALRFIRDNLGNESLAIALYLSLFC
ncbi:RNA polymerase sigma-70 factor [Puteibacter caeruleilacunae]|nr:RNA polymerase sigma-70 factor [Puteibacter caeruleilacunae]